MKALLLGRFQPPTIAHLETVRTILSRWEQLTIGVVYNSPTPLQVDDRWSEQLRQEDGSAHLPHKNPFRPEEVCRMWEACLDACALRPRVEVTPTLRPQYYPFNERFPPEVFDWVTLRLARDDKAGAARRIAYAELFGRKLYEVDPSFRLHNSNIRMLIEGGRSWDEFIPPGAYELFLELNGPQRLGLGG